MTKRLRPILKRDFKNLEDIIKRTWHFEDIVSQKTAQKLARVYLRSCLLYHNYARVVEVDQQAVGVIVLKNCQKYHRHIRYDFSLMINMISLFMSKQGRMILHFYKQVYDIDVKMLKQCHKDYQAEVALFVIDEKYRNQGLGKALFHDALREMKNQHIEHFYLYTDTSCHFAFYEYQGMIRQQHYLHTTHFQGKETKIEFYLYDMEI